MARTRPRGQRPIAPAAMVLAAGLGTRLWPLTSERPKPLVPVGDQPVLAHIATALRAAGVERLVLNTHHQADALHESKLATLPLPVCALYEPTILGTAGGVANANESLGPGDVIVWNGDILADVDLVALGRAHVASGAQASLAVALRQAGTGTVGLDQAGRVVRLRDEQFAEERAGADFVGIQVISASLRRRLPAVGCLVGDVYLPALRAGLGLCAAAVVRRWTDIGSPDSYLAANLAWLDSHGGTSYVGPGAAVGDRVELFDSVVGAEARVDGRGAVRRCVIWPGARAAAPLSNAIVTSGGTVVAVQDVTPAAVQP